MRPIEQIERPDPPLYVPVEKEKPPKRSGDYCRHEHVSITTERRVWCRDCETWIDPVDYILRIAEHWDRVKNERAVLLAENKRLRESVANLARVEANAKARIRGALKRAVTGGSLSVEESDEIRRRAGMISPYVEFMGRGKRSA